MFKKFLVKDNRITRKVVAAMTLLVFVVSMLSLDLNVVKPYAITPDGVKTNEAYSFSVDGEQIGIVASKDQGNQLVDEVEDFYVKDGSDVSDVKVLQDIDIRKIDLQLGAHVDHPQIDDFDTLFRYVMTGSREGTMTAGPSIATASTVSLMSSSDVNEDADPLIDVETTENVSYRQVVDYKTEYKSSSDLYLDETKVQTEGKEGEKTVKAELTRVNGQITDKDILSEEITKEPVNKVILKGTRINGNNVVAYAKQFLGNPYVYGGSSLTHGTDCSGFTMSVYAHFGVSLPHNSDAQLRCGKAVSYSEAQPGDLIIYPGHVGMYIGNGQIIHAEGVRTGIVIGSARQLRILGVRRVI